jgi:peptidoglycan/LPS O-acetylase OafA/YrhL
VQRSIPAPADGVAVDPTVPRTLAYEAALDGLRGISIIAVVLFHACATSSLTGWFRGGALGVSVFFTLSGFLITTVLLREAEAHGRVDLRRFWTRRIRRLAPASLTVVAGVVILGRTALFDVGAREAAATVWSWANWNIVARGDAGLLRTVLGPLGPTWSLAVEEQFYVALALVVALCTRSRHMRRALAVTFVLVTVATVAVALLASDWHPRLEFGTDARAAELAIGGLLALGVSRWGRLLRERTHWVDVVAIGALVGLVVLFLTADYTPPWLLRGGFAGVALVSSAVIVGALAHGAVSRLLSATPLVEIGRWSYSIYLVHWPVFLALTEDRVGINAWGLVAVKCASAAVAGLLLHLAVEQPVRRARPTLLAPTIAAWVVASAAVTLLAVVVA